MSNKLLFALIVGVVLAAGPSAGLRGQETRTSSGDRLEGKVQKVDREKSVIVVSYDKVTRQVLYDQSTRFTVLNQPGSLDAVKEGFPVICRGKFDRLDRLVAHRVEVQEKVK